MSLTPKLSGRRQLRVERCAAQVAQVEDGMGFPFRNHQAVIEDIGIGGIGLRMRCTALIGDRVRVVLSEPTARAPMRFHAIVRWRGGDQFGLQWTNLTGEQQLWLRSLIRTWAGASDAPTRGSTMGFDLHATPA